MATESRSTISAVCWVPRGKAALNPTSYVLASQELCELRKTKSSLIKAHKKKTRAQAEGGDPARREEEGVEADWEDADDSSEEEEEMEDKDDQDVNMDDEEDDEDDEGSQFFGVVKEDGAATLDDPYLKMGEEEDSEEEEANIILPTDLILVAATAEHDFSSLEVYVYDEDRGSFYVHHDILTGGFPLCLEWLNTCPSTSGPANLVASGSFDPEISIWNLDVLDRVDAVCTLGKKPESGLKKGRSRDGGKKKNKRHGKAGDAASGTAPYGADAQGHEGPVMCLHASPMKSQILASGSADETVRMWDLTTAACLHTYRHHENKVQALRWHPVEEAVLLSASYDRRAALVDVRKPDNVMFAPLNADAESCCWDRHRPINFWASSEDGSVCCMDVRKMSNKSAARSASSSKASNDCLVWSMRAHKGAASGLSDSKIKDLMVTCGVDGVAKLWNVTGTGPVGVMASEVPANYDTSRVNNAGTPSLVFERDLKGGPLYCCQSNEDLPNVLGFGGNCVVLWDITDTDVVKTAFNLKG